MDKKIALSLVKTEKLNFRNMFKIASLADNTEVWDAIESRIDFKALSKNDMLDLLMTKRKSEFVLQQIIKHVDFEKLSFDEMIEFCEKVQHVGMWKKALTKETISDENLLEIGFKAETTEIWSEILKKIQ